MRSDRQRQSGASPRPTRKSFSNASRASRCDDITTAIHLENAARSLAWNRLWYKMFSEILAAHREPPPT